MESLLLWGTRGGPPPRTTSFTYSAVALASKLNILWQFGEDEVYMTEGEVIEGEDGEWQELRRVKEGRI